MLFIIKYIKINLYLTFEKHANAISIVKVAKAKLLIP